MKLQIYAFFTHLSLCHILSADDFEELNASQCVVSARAVESSRCAEWAKRAERTTCANYQRTSADAYISSEQQATVAGDPGA